jgi:integrase
MNGGMWEPPRYREVGKPPFIPHEKGIDQLIAGCSKRTSTFVRLLKETGMRCGEAWQSEWIDLDTANQTIRVTPEKGSNPRMFKISSTLLSMLNSLKRESKRIFGSSRLESLRRT